MAKTQTGLRLDPAALERLERVAAKLSERAGGMDVTRADAARVALDRGLDALEVELGITPGKGTKPASKPTAKKTTTKK